VPASPDSLKKDDAKPAPRASFAVTLVQAIAILARSAARTPLRLGGFAALALVTTWPLLSTAGSLNGYRDSHPLVQYEESARRSIVEFGQLPMWDPYYCGGMDGLGTPQSRYVSPTFLLTLLFGDLRAEPIVAFLMIFLGLEGAYRYARSYKASALGAAFAAPLFALSGLFAVAPALGWYNFFGFELLPWAAFGLRRAMAGRRWGIVIAAGALAWMVGFGGTYPAPLAGLFCAFEAIAGLIERRRDRSALLVALRMAALTGALALGLAAIRLWPVAQTLQMAQRIIGGTPGLGPTSIVRALLGRIHPDDRGDFPVAGTFLVGGFAAVAVAAGIVVPRARQLVVVGALTLWLAAGYAANVSLFAAMKELPFYSTLRYPERFLTLFALAASAVAALGVTRLQVFARTRTLGAYGLTLGVGFLLANLGPLVGNHYAAARGRPMTAPPPSLAQEFHQARGTRWALAYYGPMGRGCLSCYDAYPVPQSPLLRGDLEAEEYFADPTNGTVRRVSWSPNRIELDVDAARPGRLLVNSNWHPGWRSNVGDVVNDKGLLAIDLPAGKQAVTLRFAPRSTLGGALVSVAALLALIALVARGRSKAPPPGAREALACATLPVIPFALVLGLVHEPPIPRAELKTPLDDDIVAAALPPGATTLNARFEGGITLVAARLSTPRPAPESTLTVELDWKIDPGVDPKLGIFVHLVPSAGEDLRADHVMLSDVLEIERAPTGVILRDQAQVTIPYDAGGKSWTVYAGLWRVRGNGKRIAVIDQGSAPVEPPKKPEPNAKPSNTENRVQVGTFSVPFTGPP